MKRHKREDFQERESYQIKLIERFIAEYQDDSKPVENRLWSLTEAGKLAIYLRTLYFFEYE